MARLPRLTLAGYAHHVIQRGNNRQLIFSTPDDYVYMLELLQEQAKKFEVEIHAYVLMSNHFHLLATPKTSNGLPQMMQAIGRSYVRYFNDRQGRTGTLWEGRYRSTLIQTERYLLACMVYIDLNPVRAGMVPEAKAYPWSSHGHYIGLQTSRLITPHALFWAMGNTPFAREAAYEQLVAAGIGADEKATLTRTTLSGWACGDAQFVAMLQKRTNRRVDGKLAGRPPRTSVESGSVS